MKHVLEFSLFESNIDPLSKVVQNIKDILIDVYDAGCDIEIFDAGKKMGYSFSEKIDVFITKWSDIDGYVPFIPTNDFIESFEHLKSYLKLNGFSYVIKTYNINDRLVGYFTDQPPYRPLDDILIEPIFKIIISLNRD